jgi:guanine deaminase
MSSIEPAELMRLAVDKARQGIAAGQTPFGCAIAVGGRVLAVAHNTVWADTDITAHAEIVALRESCRRAAQVHLAGAIVATTCEPCPMCTAALHWARVDNVYYGASIADAGRAGFNELRLPAADLLRMGGSSVQITGGLLADECRELFADFAKLSRSANPRTY